MVEVAKTPNDRCLQNKTVILLSFSGNQISLLLSYKFPYRFEEEKVRIRGKENKHSTSSALWISSQQDGKGLCSIKLFHAYL